jgi:DNA repair protein RadA/Sms
VAVGEVGLAGEIRPVTGTGRRLAEAARLGFTHAVVPAGSIEPGQVPAGMTVAQAGDLLEAVRLTRAERRGRADDGGAGGGDRDGGARDRDGDARGRGSATGGRDGGVSGRDEAPGDEDAAAPGF